MATNAFADWVLRGRAHQQAGRPADALPCFRRAAREDPRSPLPLFHLGEALWQLRLADDAQRAWQASASLDLAFTPPRLALAEAALTRGDFAAALAAAREASAATPDDARAWLTQAVAGAALGDPAAFADATSRIAADPAPAHAPALAAALATALAIATEAEPAAALAAALAPQVPTLPLPLVAALAGRGVPVPPAIVARRFGIVDLADLRRLALALQAVDAPTASRLATAYCTLGAMLPPPPVPLLWPQRTAGNDLRIAWIAPAPSEPAWTTFRAALQAMPAGAEAGFDHVVLCPGDVAAVRAGLAETPLAGAPCIALPARADAAAAKVLAARDCDVLVDGAGLTADVVAMLAARPARATWSLAAGAPAHREPLVQRTLADGGELAQAVDELRAAVAADRGCPYAAADLAAQWDAAVRAHREGDLARADAGYVGILAVQPGFAPALHLSGEVARAQGETDRAAAAYAAAIAAAPEFVEARLAAAELALARGAAEEAARVAGDGLARSPGDVALWRMSGRAQLARGDGAAAAAAFAHALGLAPADAALHFDHGVALQRAGDAAGAARAYQRALTFAPDMAAADFNLGVLFQQQGNHRAAIAAYRNALAGDPANASAWKNLGEALFADGQLDAWQANFRAFEARCPNALALAVYALEACQYRADFASLDRYLDGLRRDEFKSDDDAALADALEELLYLLLFFDVDGTTMLRYAQAYDAVSRRLNGAPMPRPPARRPGPVRVGYLSADLRNHVMGKMLWPVVAHHDRARFEIHFYSTSAVRDEWTEKFAAVGTRFEVVAALDDGAAAARIAADDLDLLVDLSTHTRGARPGILARKPARVQVTHVASAGTVGLTAIDYKLTDRYADVPENQEFQLERMLVMDGCVFPYRSVPPAAQHPFERARLSIAADAVVIGAFVNPLKLSRRCLRLWRDVLVRIPRARLAFSPVNPVLRDVYVRLAAAAGIAEERLLFLPQGRDDAENQARYHLVDFVLDTLPFGGVNGTMEALAMQVPVVTLVGRRHGERTSYSILMNLGVDATVAATGNDYVAIAVRLADDPAFRTTVRAAIAQGLAGSPLVDMAQHTRHLEAAYLRALAERDAAAAAPA